MKAMKQEDRKSKNLKTGLILGAVALGFYLMMFYITINNG